MLVEDDVLNTVTIALGSPSLSEYSLTSKQSALRRGLINYSEHRPIRRIGTFSTVADQQEYDIGSAYSYLLKIEDVYWGSALADSNIFSGNVIYDTLFYPALSDLDVISNESMRVISEQEQSVVQASGRYKYWMKDENVVYLDPCPTEVKIVSFVYTLIRSLDDLKEKDFQDIVDFTFIVSAMDLANKRHKILQVNEPATGFVMFQGGRFLAEQVELARKRLFDKFGGSVTVHG